MASSVGFYVGSAGRYAEPLVVLLAKGGCASLEMHVHHVLEGIELGVDVVEHEAHESVCPVASVDGVVSNGAHHALDVRLGGGDGESGSAELGELGDDVEGREGLEEDSVRVVLRVHAGGPVVQVRFGCRIDAEKRAGGGDGGARGDVQDQAALLIQHAGQDRTRDEHSGLDVDAHQISNQGIVNQVEVLGMGVADTYVVHEQTDILSNQGLTETRVIALRSLREINANASSLTLSA